MSDTALTERSARVVALSKLHRGATRRAEGRFLAEGANSVGAALATGHAREILVCEDDVERHAAILAAAADARVPVRALSTRAARKLSETTTAPGIFAISPLLDTPLTDILGGNPRILAVAVEPREPGNAGTLIRTADAMGADAVVLLGDAVDPHNGKCVRASAGSVFHVPITREHDVAAALAAIRAAGMALLATAADGELLLDDAAYVLARPLAWLFGNEAHGLPTELAHAADHRIAIPIHGRAESLNLASAAAICLYESARVAHTISGP